VIAVTDVAVLALEGRDLSTAIQVQPKLALSLIATLSRRLRATISRLEDLAFLDATHRVMRVVVNVATAGLETRGVPVVQGMTHHDIATLAGTSRETASRVISQLTREGIIAANGGRRLMVDLSRLSARLEQP
jgi:CRP/FNR family cyclic AMP-dependent transcriptional regulator